MQVNSFRYNLSFYYDSSGVNGKKERKDFFAFHTCTIVEGEVKMKLYSCFCASWLFIDCRLQPKRSRPLGGCPIALRCSVLPLIASCLSPLPGFETQLGM